MVRKKYKMSYLMPYILIHIIAFYLVPMIIVDTGSAMFILLIIIPTVCFFVAMAFGLKHSFKIWYCIMVSLIFLPSVFTYYNSSAIIYVAVFGVISFFGNGIGALIKKYSK